MKQKLTEKQKRFCEEYLIDLNATQAVIRAGYKTKHPDKMGSELLGKTRVKEYVEKRMKDRESRTEITQDRVLKELAKIGFSDIKDFLEFKTVETLIDIGEDKEPVTDYQAIINLKDSAEVDGSLISEVQLKDGTLKFKLHDKMKALDSIGRHLGMFTDKVEHSGEQSVTIKMEGELDEWSK